MSDDAIAATLRSGLAAHEAGRIDEAEGRYRQVLEVSPDNADAQQLLATLLVGKNQITEALGLFIACLHAMGGNPAVRCNFGIALAAAGKIEEAIEQFTITLTEHGDLPTALFHLARLEKARGNLGRTVDLLGRLLKMHAGTFESLLMFGEALTGIGQLEAGRAALLQAAQLARLDINKINLAGEAMARLSFHKEAVETLRVALTVKEDFVPALVNIAVAEQGMGNFAGAFSTLHKALKLSPQLPAIKANLAQLYIEMGDAAAGVDLFRQLVLEHPENPLWHEAMLFNAIYLPDYDGPALLEESRAYAQRHRGSSIQPHHTNAPHPEKRLRVGYLSPDYKDHPAKLFNYPLYKAHSRTEIEVFLYSATPRTDDWTRRFQATADSWRDVAGETPERIADRIRADKIDILVDCAGYTALNPMQVFKLKPAPVQATLSIVTTGLPQMDWYLSPAQTVPDHLPPESLYSEKLAPIISCLPFESEDGEEIAVSDLPALRTGHITFGCNANLAKVTPEVSDCFAKILKQVPNSRLKLKSKALRDRYVAAYWSKQFADKGISPNRIDLIGYLPRHEHVNHYNTVDIGLDTFPFNGNATTFEFLWGGVPVITKAGNNQQARLGLSILHHVGLDALAAETLDGYVAKAVMLASDIPGLASLRASLRPRLKKSVMLDPRAVAASFEEQYRLMWREWCRR